MWRLALVIAIVAALLGAPPAVSAASNELRAASVTPTSGVLGTAFVLRVTYEGVHPATSVTATIGPVSLPMTRVSGTTTAGTWQVTATNLLAGTWPVTFVATATKGNAPTLAAAPLTVIGPITPPSATPAPPTHGADPGAEPDAGLPTLAPGPDPTRAEPAPAGPAPSSETAAPGDPPDTAEPKRSDAPGTTAGGQEPAEPALPAEAESEDVPPRSGDASPTDDSTTGGATPGVHRAEGPEGAPAEAETEPPTADPATEIDMDDLATASGAVAIWATALLGLVAALAVVLARRRRHEPVDAASAVMSEKTAALLEQRVLRRARTVIEPDPIVSALGVDDAELAKRNAERKRRRRRDLG